MADCRKCRYNYKPSTCEPKCNRMCDGESGFEPITNAMRIRSMSDEELADFIAEHNQCCLGGTGEIDCAYNADCRNCKAYVLKWLKSEAK